MTRERENGSYAAYPNNKPQRRSAPIFVVGANRSGTTLLRLLLNAHSRIAIPEELTYFNEVLAGVPVRLWHAPDLTPDHYRTFVHNFLHRNAEAFRPLRVDDLEMDILRAGVMDLRHPYQTALEAWAQCHGKARWGEKTPGNLFYVDVILDMFPQARFIYIVRDPRAGVLSMMRAPMFVDDPVINALNRRRYATEGLARLDQAVPSRQRTVIRYEDLVADPEAAARSLCSFLDESFEPDMLRFYEDAQQYMTRRAATGFNLAATRPISTDRIDEWRDRLRGEEIALIESICAAEMKRFGYEREADIAPSLAQHLDVLAKHAYLKLQCWRHSDAPQYLLKHRVFDRSRRRLRRARNRFTTRNEPWGR